MAERHTLVPAVLFVLENPQGEVLLHLRQNTGFADGFWSLPGGHFEPNEHVLNVIKREAQEELGVAVEEEGIHFIGMHHIRRKDGLDGLNLYYKITKWQGTPSNTEPATCAGMHWFALNNLPENTFPEFFDVITPKPPHLCLAGTFQPRLGQPLAEKKV